MQGQEKRSMLEAQVQSLKDIVKTLEGTNPDEVAKKWRAKVFEELMRNKQQQITHTAELRKAQEDTRRLQTKTEELLLALQKCQSSLTAISQENSSLQQRLLTERQEKAVLVNIQKQQQVLLLASPQHLQGQFEVMADILNKVEKYEQKISVCQSQVRAARIIADRERTSQGKRARELRGENERLKAQTYQAVAIAAENETVKRHIGELQGAVQQISREKAEFVAELKGKLEEKVGELAQARELWENHTKTIEGRLKDAQFALETAQSEISMLKTTLAASIENNTSKSTDIESLKNQIAKLESALFAQKSDSESHIKSLFSDFDSKLTIEKQNFESDLSQLRLELITKRDELNTFRLDSEAEKNELIATISTLERTVKDMKRDRGLLLSSLKTQERKPAVPTATKEVQTVTDAPRSAEATVKPANVYDDLFAQCRDLLDAP